MTIGVCAAAGPTRVHAAIDAAANINLRMFPPAYFVERAQIAPKLVCQPHQYREADGNAIAPLAGAILRALLQRKMRHPVHPDAAGRFRGQSLARRRRTLCPASGARSNRGWLTGNSPEQNA